MVTIETNKTDLFENMPVPKAVRTMVIPTIIAQMIVLIYNMADTFFLGKMNDPFMVAGVSLILPLFNITGALSNLGGIGGGTLISRLLGLKREEEAKKVASFDICFIIGLGLIYCVIILAFMKPLLYALGADDTTYLYASQYATMVLVCGGIPTIMSTLMAHLLRSVGESRKAGIGTMMGGILNIGLDPLFMFCFFPADKAALAVGVATLISNCIACIYYLIVVIRLGKDSIIRFVSPGNLPEKDSIKNLFSVGVPSFIASFFFDLDYIIIDKLMSAYGTVPLAAMGIVLKVERLPLNAAIGICQGMVPIVAYNYSAKNHPRMRQTIRYSYFLAILIGVISVSLYEIFAGYIVRFFIAEPETVALGTDFLRIRSIATLLMFTCFFFAYLFNSFGKGGYALFLGLARWCVFNIPLQFLMNYLFGMFGIAWTQFVADALTVILTLIIYTRYAKKQGWSGKVPSIFSKNNRC